MGHLRHFKRILQNGVRVVLAPMRNTRAVSIVVLVGTGSNYEPKEINGISHFLEHLFLRAPKTGQKPPNVCGHDLFKLTIL